MQEPKCVYWKVSVGPEVRAQVENGFLLKYFALINACVQESYFCI